MGKDTFDSKLVTLLILKNIKKIILGTIIITILIAVPYALSKTVIGNFDYRSEVTVHVEFGEDSSGAMYDYINFYGWQQWIASDVFVDKFCEKLADVDKETLKTYLSAEVPADQRIVVFTVVTHDPELTDRIAAVISEDIEALIIEIPEVKNVKLMDTSKAVKYFVYNSIPEVTIFAFIIGFIVSVLAVRLSCILDDSVYIPMLFEKEWGVKALKSVTEDDGQESKSENQMEEIYVGKKLPEIPDAEAVKLVIPCGARNGKVIEYTFHECEKHGIKINSVRLENLDEKLISAYYREFKLNTFFMKNSD